ncbi:Gfo/Idh/MocA family oxidoreductase, partial [bacterium]|nr:Gfo/Idh/MocA family oxidoreductase [bacterium]
MLKIGMIGAGFVAGFHERALCSVRGVELTGICAPDGAEALARRACQDGLGNAKVYANVAAICDAVDVICIFAPNYVRLDIMRNIAKAIENGAKIKGIICE